MNNYVIAFENNVRNDGQDFVGPFIVTLSEEEVAILKSNTIFPFVGYVEQMYKYTSDHPKYKEAVLFNELYNIRPWIDIDQTGPILINGLIHAWMSTDL